jgi:methyl-accepting chemotaxis protein
MNGLSVSRRLLGLGVFSLAARVVLASLLVSDKRRQMLDDRRLATKHVVEVARGLVEQFAAQQQAGLLSVDEAQARAKSALKGIRYEGQEYFWVHTQGSTPTMVMHPTKPALDGTSLVANKDPTGKAIFVDMNQVVASQGAGFVEYSWPRPGADLPVPKISYVAGFAPWGWVIGSGIYVDDVSSAFWADVRRLSLSLLAISLVLAAGFLLVRRSILEPLREAMAVAERTAAGDLAVVTAHRPGSDEFSELLNSLGRMQNQLQTMVSAIRHGAETMRGTMKDVLGGNVAVERAAQDQVARLEETSSTIEELSSTVKANAETARTVDARARDTAELAATGGEAMHRVTEAMKTARSHAGRIGEMSDLIDELAFQTNLLAINASVEAARAGDQGRGFAVVANEVRTLALKSASAAKEIKTLVRDTTVSIQDSAQAADGAGQVVAQVVSAAQGLASLVSDITNATREQAQALSQASSAVTDIDRSTQQSVSVVGRTAEAARGLSGEAQSLIDAVSQFHLAPGFEALESADEPRVT